MSNHVYIINTEIVERCGINAAILANFISDELEYDEHDMFVIIHDNEYWLRCPQRELSEYIEWMSVDMVASALNRLIIGGILKKGYFNDSSFDHTAWYSLTELGKYLLMPNLDEEEDDENDEEEKEDIEEQIKRIVINY